MHGLRNLPEARHRLTGCRKGRAVLCGPALVFFALFLLSLGPGVGDEEGLLAADVAWALASSGSLVIVDVRTEREWRTTGLPDRAVGVSLSGGSGSRIAEFVEKVFQTVDGDRARALAVICAGGVRSARAADILRRNGFLEVYDIGEGMSGNSRQPGWIARGLPLIVFQALNDS